MYTVLEKGGVCSPKGFTASGICAGIKASGNADMALLKSEKAARCFAVFTTNKVKAAPVLYDKAALEHAHFATAVVVNSGNANACTGEQGYKDAERMATLTEGKRTAQRTATEAVMTAAGETFFIQVSRKVDKPCSEAFPSANSQR